MDTKVIFNGLSQFYSTSDRKGPFKKTGPLNMSNREEKGTQSQVWMTCLLHASTLLKSHLSRTLT